MNIADEAIVGAQALKYYGTAEKAEALVVGGTYQLQQVTF